MALMVSKQNIKKIPSTTGVYLFKKDREILYIGKSVNLKARILSHLENAKIDKKEAAIVDNSNLIEWMITDSEFKALILEASLINKIQPKYNVIWRDDKSNLYVKITTDEIYPKISAVRKTEIDEGGGGFEGFERSKTVCFGPFSSDRNVEAILKEIRRVFPFCTQKKVGKHACFYSKIGLCHPCPGDIEAQKDEKTKQKMKRLYRKNIGNIIRIFQGKTDPVLKNMYRELKTRSKSQDYEKAIVLRNRIYRFEQLIHQRLFMSEHSPNYNQSTESISSLLKILKPYFPKLDTLARIECYDVSNLNQKCATASLVVMTDGLIDKSQYRRFKIKNLTLQSDFEMLEEVLKRRFKRSDWLEPQLIVIDGGRPQIRTVRRIFSELEIKTPLIGIAKHPDRLVIGVDNLPVIRPPANHLGFNLIKSLRDESHRFARKYHLLLRDKRLLI
jgi:excinuclease ABC subunit C